MANLVKSITKTEPVIVHSDIEGADNLITDFGKSKALWIVTVRMVSEGVDIKRLRVGIYATNYKTQLFFQQAIARTTRYDSTVKGMAGDGQPVRPLPGFLYPTILICNPICRILMTVSIHHIAEGLESDSDGRERLLDGQSTFLEAYEFIDGRDAVGTVSISTKRNGRRNR